MKITFCKMNGAGNDFVLIDGRANPPALGRAPVARICDRRRGVGADGVIVLERSSSADFTMRFFNADGSEAGMCGNGARCAAAFAVSRGAGIVEGTTTRVRFETGTGLVDASVEDDHVVMDLMDAQNMRVGMHVQVAQRALNVHFMTVGTRHVIVPVDDAVAMPDELVTEQGRELRLNPAFGPEGANVNFCSVSVDGRIHLRTYEKGVEAQTYACGTGSVACAVYLAHERGGSTTREVVQHSGDVLTVSFIPTAQGATAVRLGGPVSINFLGTVSV